MHPFVAYAQLLIEDAQTQTAHISQLSQLWDVVGTLQKRVDSYDDQLKAQNELIQSLQTEISNLKSAAKKDENYYQQFLMKKFTLSHSTLTNIIGSNYIISVKQTDQWVDALEELVHFNVDIKAVFLFGERLGTEQLHQCESTLQNNNIYLFMFNGDNDELENMQNGNLFIVEKDGKWSFMDIAEKFFNECLRANPATILPSEALNLEIESWRIMNNIPDENVRRIITRYLIQNGFSIGSGLCRIKKKHLYGYKGLEII